MEIYKISNNNSLMPGSSETSNQNKTVKDDTQSKTDNSNNKEVKVDQKDLKSAVDKANKMLFKNNTHLKFEIHDKTKEVMVKIINDESGEVLKEIPPKKMLDMVAKLWEIAGILVDEKR
jgi:flagellar protein FlaG